MPKKIEVIKIRSKKELEIAHKIRCQVFVLEQNVPLEDEIDQFEDTATHFLASMDRTPCATARWRLTSKGVKLERFAVLAQFRRRGIGSELMKYVLADIAENPKLRGKRLYLNAQLPAMALYRKFGFKKVGEIFKECDIDHYKMVRTDSV